MGVRVPKHNRLLSLAELSVAESSSLNRWFWEESSHASPRSGGSCVGGRTEVLLSVLGGWVGWGGGGAGLQVIRTGPNEVFPITPGTSSRSSLTFLPFFFLGKLQQSAEFRAAAFRAAAFPAAKRCWRSCCEGEVTNVFPRASKGSSRTPLSWRFSQAK